MNDVLCSTKYLELKSTKAKSGEPWVYAHRPNAKDVVVILPHTKDEILFLIEERPPIQAENKGRYCISVPAGLVGDERIGESVEDAIKAELREEAGLQAEKINIVAKKVSSSSGCLSETCTLCTAEIKDKNPVCTPVSDGGIITDRVWIKKQDVKQWLGQKEAEGYVLTGQTLACLYYLFG